MIVIGQAVVKWVCEAAGANTTPQATAVGWMVDGKLVCGIVYDGFTGTQIAMHSRCDDPRKVSREWLFAIFDYPFNQLKVKRVTGLVSSGNLKAQRVNEHLGWRRETTLADYFPDGDGIVYIMRRENCRWLDYSKHLSKGDGNEIKPLRNAATASLQETLAGPADA